MALNINIRRGSNYPDIWFRLKTADGSIFTDPSSHFVLSIWVGGQKILEKDTSVENSGFTYDATKGLLIWKRTLQESRLFNLNKIANFEIERRFTGGEQFVLEGTMTGIGGLNTDG